MVRRHHKASIVKLIKSFYISQITRYIPGNIWSYISRVNENAKYDVSKSTSVYLLILENITLISTSFIFSLFAINLINISSYITYLLVAICVLVYFILFFNPKIFGIIIDIFAKKFKTEVRYNELSKIDLIIVFIFFSIFWILFGMSFYFVTNIFLGTKISLLSAIGINAFAWLVGYLSFLTPSGLIVRESTFVLILIKYTTSVIGTNIAIISRFVFTISELIGLGLIYIFDFFLKEKKMILKYLNLDITKIFLIIFTLIYIVYFSFLTINKYINLDTGRYDLGNMDQTVCNTEHGRIFEMENPDNDKIISRMAVHSDVILVILAPLYYLYESPITLLLIQTFVIALGVIPVYILGKKVIKNNYAALIFSISYLLYPALEGVNSYEFHGVSLAITFLLFAFLYVYENKYLYSFIFCLLAFTTKEEIGFVIFLLGLYIIFFKKNFKVGMMFSFIGLLVSIVLIWFIIPSFRPNEIAHFAVSYFSSYGDTPTGVVEGIASNPFKVFGNIFNFDTLNYLIQIFVPVGFLSLFNPQTLFISFSEFAINLISNNSSMKSISFQYTSAIIPFVFISSIFGFDYLNKKLGPIYDKKLKKYLKFDFLFILLLYILFNSIFFNYQYGILPFSKDNLLGSFESNIASSKVSKLEKLITSNYSVTTSNSLGAHFTHRRYIYNFPIKINDVDYIILPSNEEQQSYDKNTTLKIIDSLKEGKLYNLKYDNCNLYVFERKDLKDPVNIDWNSL